MNAITTDIQPAQRERAEPTAALAVHDARALTRGGQQALITLDEKTYVLRITRAGKLILTK